MSSTEYRDLALNRRAVLQSAGLATLATSLRAGSTWAADPAAIKPTGRLPFELPLSMAAVAAQRSDMPHDSADPLGSGLHY